MKRATPAALRTATAAFALALSSSAFPQLEEIVVTAQKVEKNLQDVPIAITAFDSEALENQRIEGLEDIGKLTPGLYVTPNSADVNGVQINIRGIGVLDPQIGQDSRVAIYQDGIYLGKTQGLAFDMPDLERVEVVKGPQGTLYGRNTVAGAVNLISAAPRSGETSGKIKAEYGNFNHFKIAGAANVSMSDGTALRLSGLYLDRKGWVENDGSGSDFGGETKYGFRASLGIDLSDDFNLNIAGDYNKVEKEPLLYQAVGTPPGAPPFGAAVVPFNDGRQEHIATPFAPEVGDLETSGVSIVGTWRLRENHELKATFGYRSVDSSRFTTLLPTVDTTTLNAVTGGFNRALAPLPFAFQVAGQGLRPDFATAFSGTTAEEGLFLSPPGGGATLDGHDQYSLELTYNGEFADGKVEFTGGFFYFDEETGTGPLRPNPTEAGNYLFVLGQFDPRITAPNVRAYLNSIDIDPATPGQQILPASATGPIPAAGVLLGTINGIANNPNIPPALIPGLLATPTALLRQLVGNGASCGAGAIPSPTNNFCIPTLSASLGAARQATLNEMTIDTKAYALYGQATWHITDRFRATLGLRYSNESKDGVSIIKSLFFHDTTDLLGNPIAPNIASFDDEFLDPSVILEFDVNPDVLVYLSYKESFRSGGFNATAVGLRLPGETFGPDFNFGAESITAYEVGLKGTFGGRFRYNTAGFYYDFTDRQTTVSLNPLVATQRAVVNTDDEIYGVELDAQYLLNEQITLSASYSWVDGDSGDVINPLTQAVEVRDDIQGTPKNSWSAAIDYNDQWGAYEVFANINYVYKDEILRIPQTDFRLPDFDLLNARIGLALGLSDGQQVTASLWATNLLDEEYLVDGLNFGSFAHDVHLFGQPRSYGLALNYSF